MRVDRRRGGDERKVLVGMIADSIVLGRITSRWNEKGLFSSRWSNLIGEWCVEYFREYEEAPGKAIEGLFSTWAEVTRDQATVELVERFLGGLSREYEKGEINSEYLVDLAGRHFNQVKISRLAVELKVDLERGRVAQAAERVVKFEGVELGEGVAIDVLSDIDAWREAFSERTEPLIRYPGALDKFFGRTLGRDSFIAFMGPEKRGKSFWLLDLAWRAMSQRKRVAYFEAGDHSQNQVMRRFAVRIARQPLYPKVVRLPKKIIIGGKREQSSVKVEVRRFRKPLDWRVVWEKSLELRKLKIKSEESYLRLTSHPAGTLTVSSIRAKLEEWERRGWIPDVIVIDFADILAPEFRSREFREQVNETWRQLRALSQSRHCLVVTATQADAASYSKATLGMSNFSEDKRKLGYVSGMVGLNQLREEKELDLMRLHWIVLRERVSGFQEQQVYVAGCRDLANPAVLSCFREKGE